MLKAIHERTVRDALHYQLYLDADCVLDREKVAGTLEELLRRSLIQPLPRLAEAERITLSVTADCIPGASNLVFSLEVAYVAAVHGVNWKLDWEYASLGVADSEHIGAVIEERVEDAILDFLRAHS